MDGDLSFPQDLRSCQCRCFLFRKPLATAAASPEFIRAILRLALIRIGMPPPAQQSESTVLTKVNLWGVVIFYDHLDRNFPMQDFIDI